MPKKYPKCSEVKVKQRPDSAKAKTLFYSVSMGGRLVGEAEAYINGNRLEVGYIDIDKSVRSCGVGTRVYQHLYKTACKRGLVLSSDIVRSPLSENFWKKQARKGRATCIDTHHKGAHRIDPDDYGVLPGKWSCHRWGMKSSCPPKRSYDLTGPRKRRRY